MKRIGFVGAGKHAQWAHIPSYAALDGCELAAVTDGDLGLAKAVAAKFGIRTAYRTHNEMLSKEKLDLVVVTLPPLPAAERIICDVLAAGVPLCAEKPLALSVAAGERITRAAEEAGSFFRIGYHKRSDPATMYGRREIEHFLKSGVLGKIRHARVHVSLAGDWTTGAYRSTIAGTAPGPAAPMLQDDFAGLSAAAKEVFQGFAAAHSHQFDLMRCLLGEPYRIAYADPSGIVLAVESSGGIPGTFEFSPYNSTKEWVEHAVVSFERGYIKITLPAPLVMYRAGTVEVFRDDGDAQPSRTYPVFPYKSAMQQQAENMIAAISGAPDGMCQARQALESLVIARDWAMRLHP